MPQIFVKTQPSTSSSDLRYEVDDREQFVKDHAAQIYWYFFPEDDDWHRGPAFKLAKEAQAIAEQESSDPDDEDRL